LESKISIDKKLKAYIAYLRFELALNERYDLDFIQVRVFNEIVFGSSLGKTLNVGDILSHREIASQATIHAALKKLVGNKLISYRTVSSSRVKYLEITPLGQKRLSDLSKALSGN
jgi:DNA-binding MarR family transcriptional regulator